MQEIYRDHFQAHPEDFKIAGLNSMFQDMHDPQETSLRSNFITREVFTDELEERTEWALHSDFPFIEQKHYNPVPQHVYCGGPPSQDLETTLEKPARAPAKQKKKHSSSASAPKNQLHGKTQKQHIVRQEKMIQFDEENISESIISNTRAVAPFRVKQTTSQVLREVNDLHKALIKTPRSRNKSCPQFIQKLDASTYYREKPVDPSSMRINPRLHPLDFIDHNSGQMHAIKCYSKLNLKEPKHEKNGELVSPEEA